MGEHFEKFVEDKVGVIEGDLCLEKLGLSQKDE